MTDRVDCVVIGAGVIGLAVGRALSMRGREVLVLEREAGIGTGVSARNSEVIHAGVYYPDGSLKARLSRRGRDLLYAYCRERGVPHRQCGKLIVASGAVQREELERVATRATRNEVLDLRRIGKAELREMEPAVSAETALFSPSSGIIDIHALMLAYQGDIENAGGMVLCHTPVLRVEVQADDFLIETGGAMPTRLIARTLINSTGLDAQTTADSIAGFDRAHIPPRRISIGHYYMLSGRSPFHHLVYPATAQDGGQAVHVTLDLGGQARFGPDARWIDTIDYDFDDSRRADFVAAIRTYYPGLDEARLVPGYTGIRPKLSGPGGPVADFVIQGPAAHGVAGLVNLFGIESPGLTASLAIADRAAEAIHPRHIS